jgi:hypothetical protein
MNRYIVLAAIPILGAGTSAFASTLDQVNEGPFTLAAYATDTREGRPVLETGQSFTAGLTGQLTRIDLALWRGFYRLPGGEPIAFETDATLYVYSDSLDTLGILGFSDIPLGTGTGQPIGDPFSISLDLTSLGIGVEAGRTYIAAVRSTALLPGNAILIGSRLGLFGSISDTYAGGTAVLRNGGAGTFDPFGNGDLLFRTYVEPQQPGIIPEPASWAMMIAGFGLVGAVARRRRMPSGLSAC